MGPVLAIVAAVIAVAVAVIVVTLRKKAAEPTAEPQPAPRPSAPAANPAAPAPPRPAPAPNSPPAARPPAPSPQAAPASGPPAAVLDKVACTFNSAVHGAMPPFGKLSFAGNSVIFEAVSRVVTKAGGLGDDGSSTLQSLGAIEMGKYRFEIGASTIQRIDFNNTRAVVHCDGGVYEFEGFANCAQALKPWFSANGLAD